MWNDIGWRAEGDELVGPVREVDHPVGQHLPEHRIRRLDERQPDDLGLMPALDQLRRQPFNDETRPSIDKRYEGGAERHSHSGPRAASVSAVTIRSMSPSLRRAWVGRLMPDV